MAPVRAASSVDEDDHDIRAQNSKNYINNKLQSFACDVSVIGMRYTVDGRKTVIEKMIWTTLILFGMGFAVYQINDRVQYFLQYPTASDFEIDQNDILKFPQVTFCNENVMNKSAANESGLANVLSSMFPLIPHVLPDPDLSAFSNWNWTDETIEELHRFLAPALDKSIHLCRWKGAECNMSWFRPIFTNMGYCFTFNADDTNLTSSSAGASDGLLVVLDVDQKNYMVTNSMSMNAGFRILIHDQSEVPLVQELGLKVSSAYCSSIALSQRKVYNCSLQAEVDFHLDVNGSSSCECPSQCSSIFYDFTTSQSVFSLLALNFIRGWYAKFGLQPPSELESNFATLQIYFSTMQTQTVSTSAAYSLMALLSDIGGALGLLLGSTLLTAIEVADFTAHLVLDVIKLRREGSKIEPTVKHIHVASTQVVSD